MLHDLLAWCLHSPRRLVLMATAAIGIVVVLSTIAPIGTHERADRTDGSVVGAIAPTASPGGATTGPDRAQEKPASWKQVRATARSFLTAYLPRARGSATERIDPDLERWVTPALWRGLRLADPEQLPPGPVISIEEIATGAFASEASAHLDAGLTLLLTLVAWDDGWRVADVRLGERP